MGTHYELNSFNPVFAKDIDFTGNGIMFSYNDLELYEQVKAWNGDEVPEDIIISLTPKAIVLYPVYVEDEEPEDCFFMVKHQAGQDLIAWVGTNAFSLSGEVLEDWTRSIFYRFCYEPTESGGISLDDLPGKERKAMYKASVAHA